MKQKLEGTVKKCFKKMGFNITRAGLTNKDQIYAQLYEASDIKARRFYNIGAGLFKHPYWTNIDYYSDWYGGNEIDINLDLLKCPELPIPDKSANVIYTSHTIEHLTDEAVQNIFNESHRALKAGGYLRATTPNIDLYRRVLDNGDADFWKWQQDLYMNLNREELARKGLAPMKERPSNSQIFLCECATQTSSVHIESNGGAITDETLDMLFQKYPFEVAMDLIKSRCDIAQQYQYPGHHINWFHKEKLFEMLQCAGFQDIYLSAYGQSLCPVLRDTELFDSTHPQISIYIEARKGCEK